MRTEISTTTCPWGGYPRRTAAVPDPSPGRPVRFCTIPEAELPLFRALPGRVEITEEENFADYLYSAER